MEFVLEGAVGENSPESIVGSSRDTLASDNCRNNVNYFCTLEENEVKPARWREDKGEGQPSSKILDFCSLLTFLFSFFKLRHSLTSPARPSKSKTDDIKQSHIKNPTCSRVMYVFIIIVINNIHAEDPLLFQPS